MRPRGPLAQAVPSAPASAPPALVAVLAVFALSACGSSHETDRKVETVRDVEIAVVSRAVVPDAIEASGTVRSAAASVLTSESVARVLRIAVREGDAVRQGQTLIFLDDEEPRAAMEQATRAEEAAKRQARAAESEAALAESTYHRYETLHARNSVSAQEWDEVRSRRDAAAARREAADAQVSAATAQVAQARARLAHTQVKAPFDGIVTSRSAEPGVLAAPGSALLTVEKTQPLRLEVAIGEDEVRDVSAGASATVRIDSLAGEPLQGIVTQVLPSADPGNRSVLVKVDLPNRAGLRPGLFGRASFVRGERRALVVPSSALLERGSLRAVYVVAGDSVATLRYVTVGRPIGDGTEILTGLAEGERVIVSPGSRAFSGTRIEAR